MSEENVEVKEKVQEEVVESAASEATEVEASPQSPGAPPPNNLVLAILVTILCCWPLGIPAIIFAAQVNSKFAQGDYAGAEDSSKKAKMWSIIALCAGLLVGLLYILLMMVGALAGGH